MNEIFKLFLSLSVSGSVLAFVLFGIKPLIKNRLSKRWQYYIWLIVILRFLVPFTPEFNMTGSLFGYLENKTSFSTEVAVQEQVLAQTDDNFIQSAPETENLTFPKASPNYWTDIKSGIWLLWLCVAVLLLVQKVTSYHNFIRYIKAGMHRIEEERFLGIYKEISKEAGVKKTLPIYVNQLASSPMLVGIFCPVIIIPKREIDDDQWRNVILHELTHYKRLDIFYKWLTQITVCLHWFNPIVYIINSEINKYCELSCDEAILNGLDKRGRLRYGDTLLSTLKTGYSATVVSVTLSENAKQLKERLAAILNFRKKTKIVICLSMFLGSVFLCGAAFAGAYTAGTIESTKKNVMEIDNKKLDYKPRKLNMKSYPLNETAKAERYTLVEHPNVDITIDNNAAVDFIPTSDSEITVDYNNNLYQASVENENGNWKIHISYIGNESVYSSAVMNVPSMIYGNVDLQIKTATVEFNEVFQNIECIKADMVDSSIFYTFPAGFTGTLNAVVSNCYIEIDSDNEYKNCDVSIIKDDCLIEDFPDEFTKRNGIFTYTNGTQAGTIKFNLKDGSYAIIK